MAGAAWPFGQIGQLLLLTGARRDEVAGMKWSELDLEARVWPLPKTRTKNKRDHEVPLSDAAVSIIRGLPRLDGAKGGFVFSTTGKTAVSGFSRAKLAIDKVALELAKEKEQAEAQGEDRERVGRLYCVIS
jgi:integrase